MSKNKYLILIVIATILLSFSLVYFNHKNKGWVQLGDQVAIFNQIDENGKETQSVVAVYDSDFTNKKLIIKLDEIFYSIDQLNWTKSKGIDNQVKLRAYNDESYQDITLNLKDKKVKKSEVINKKYNGDEQMELNVFSNGNFELSKPDSYLKIKDPNLYIDSKYYSLSDYTQLTNYESY